MVTQGELARELGVTTAAVCMALRNHPRISRALREKARALAAARGYAPNPVLSRMRAGRRGSGAGVAMALVTQSGLSRWERSLMRRLSDGAARLGYSLECFEVERCGGSRRTSAILAARGVEAVLIKNVTEPDFVEQFEWDRFSVAAYDSSYLVLPCHVVMPDLSQSIRLCLEKILRAGYRRVGCLVTPNAGAALDDFDKFGALCLLEAQAKAAGHVFEWIEASRDDIPKMRAWLARFRPDAVLAQNPGHFWALKEAGLRIPERLGIACWALSEDGRVAGAHRLCGCLMDHLAMGSAALKVLDAEVRQFERGLPEVPIRQLVPMPWRDGDTLPGPKGETA